MQYPKQKDIIDRHIDTAERIRKLEVMRSSRTLVPRVWWPDRNELDLIVGTCAMHGFWSSGSEHQAVASLPGDPKDSLPVHVPYGSQYLYSYLTEGGFSSIGMAQQFTNFWQILGVIPVTSVFEAMDVTTSPSTDPNAHLGGVASGTAALQGIQGGDDPTGKHLFYYGLPAGQTGNWDWISSGTALGGGLAMPNYGQLSDPRTGALMGGSGGYLYIPSGGDGIIDRNNKWYTFVPGAPELTVYHDCEGPYEPRYSGFYQPGNPMTYDSGPGPCPTAPPGTNNLSGSVFRVKTGLGWPSCYLACPPVPNTGGAPYYNYRSQLPFGYTTPNWPGWKEMRDNVNSLLPHFPSVAAWYNDRIPAAQGQLVEAANVNWQPLELTSFWTGRLEFRVENGYVFLRGKVRIPANFTTGSTGACAVLPPSSQFPLGPGLPGESIQQRRWPVRVTDRTGTQKTGAMRITLGQQNVGSTEFGRYLFLETEPFTAPNGPYVVEVNNIRLPIDLTYQPQPPIA